MCLNTDLLLLYLSTRSSDAFDPVNYRILLDWLENWVEQCITVLKWLRFRSPQRSVVSVANPLGIFNAYLYVQELMAAWLDFDYYSGSLSSCSNLDLLCYDGHCCRSVRPG